MEMNKSFFSIVLREIQSYLKPFDSFNSWKPSWFLLVCDNAVLGSKMWEMPVYLISYLAVISIISLVQGTLCRLYVALTSSTCVKYVH